MIDIIKIDTIRNNKYFNNEKNKPAKKKLSYPTTHNSIDV